MKRATNRRAKGSGSITKKGDIWFCRIEVKDAEGKTRHRTFNAKTKVEGNKWLEEMNRQRGRGKDLSKQEPTVSEYLSQWLNERQSEVRPSTYRSYQLMVESYIRPHIGNLKLSAVTRETVVNLFRLHEKEGKSANTIRIVRIVLNNMLEQAFRDDLLTQNVVRKTRSPRVEHKTASALRDEVAIKLFAACNDHPQGLLIQSILTLGLRKGEALGLRWEAVNFEDGTAQILSQLQYENGVLSLTQLKTQKSKRTMRLPDILIQKLRHHQETQSKLKSEWSEWVDSGHVFTSSIGTPLDPRKVGRILDELMDRIEEPRIRVHDLRHSAATLMLQSGVSIKTVSDVLGHSQASLTADTYVHLVPALESEAVNGLGRLLNGKS